MFIRMATLTLSLSLSILASAQDVYSLPKPPQELPEEVVITGDRSLGQLHTRMLEAEKKAYDLFNQFNDEKRFRISCNQHRPTGSLLKNQICQAEFEREATRGHARDYWENLRALYDPYSPYSDPHVAAPAQEAMIASQQREYRKKLKQVAEEQPEFLDAIIQYSELQAQYRDATRTVKQ